jgi:hypothetical protein
MSRLRVWWVSLLGLALVQCTVPSLEDLWRERGFCAVGDEDCGMLRIRVDAQGFVPGCLRFTVRDAEGTASLNLSVPYRGTERAGRTLTQGFSPKKDWGLRVAVSVDAFEQGCDGKVVTTQTREAPLREGGISELAFVVAAVDADGDGYVALESGGTDCDDNQAAVNPGATELCNAQDDNCNGEADENLGVGEPCTSEDNCAGVKACGMNGAVVCVTGPVQRALVDEDQDGYGDMAQAPVVVCSNVLPPGRLPLDAPRTDCNDADPAVHPGATEVCNGRDDNCVDGVDEGFNVGTACTESQTQCAGMIQCVSQGETQCVPASPVPTWYPDEDQDSYGASGGAVRQCPMPAAGYVVRDGDCDDGNPFIHVNAREICDEQDNDCNGAVDEGGVCAGGLAGWESRQIDGNSEGSNTWFDIAFFGDGGVWLVGSNSSRAVKQGQGGAFTVLPGKCSTGTTPKNLFSIWAHPGSGRAYIGGADGLLLIQDPDSVACSPRSPPNASGDVRGLAGFVLGDGGVSIFGATDNGPTSGGTFAWSGDVVTVPAQSYSGRRLFKVDGVSPDLLFAVGSSGNTRSSIFRRTAGSSVWVEEPGVPDGGPLAAIDVVNSRLAYAVGDNGTFLVWNGISWSVGNGPPVTSHLTGVLAFGSNSIYVTSADGYVYRFNGKQWGSPLGSVDLYAIDGTAPDDLWAVGLAGYVFHYPAWPQ